MVLAFTVLLSWGIFQSYEQQIVQQQQEVYTKGLKIDKFLETTFSNVNLLRSQAEYFLKSTPDVQTELTTYNYTKRLDNNHNLNLIVLKDSNIGAVSPVFTRTKNTNLGHEVEMSLSLTPLLRPIYEQLPIEGRIRYTSFAALTMTYPATSQVTDDEKIKIFKNARNQEIITGGMQKNNPTHETYLTHPYKDIFDQELIVTATSPIYHGDKHLGNIGIDFKLEALNRFVEQLGGEHSLLLTVDGKVLSRHTMKTTSAISLEQLVKNPVVRTTLLKLLKNARNSQVTIDGYVLTYYKLQNVTWGIANVTPVNTLAKNILIKYLPVICGVLIGFTGLLLVSIRTIDKIFKKLDKARIIAEQTNKKLKRALNELEVLALTDKLTGAWNRRHFEQVISAEMSRASRHNQPLSVLILDIDYFKSINDRYGHQVGDAVLVQLTHILKENIRTSDVLTRWGGEEFVILTPFTSVKEATDLAERLRLKIARASFKIVKNITISLGVAQFQTTENVSNFLKRADAALYQAKHSGRNLVAVAPSTLDTWIQGVEKNI
ncbi:hypothetical protein DSM106972_065140 [Dulcicalothrix desertica PCC 7102]|uniref:GGDEF domain-containing protein n=2 Tax=Dulcicalothrix desertica TaxID=32056 RepID=A0A433V740_9CYAN|nr:hypothetical protein DSM106972_065140 [Dulcicalothrix desertica PCC 7102]